MSPALGVQSLNHWTDGGVPKLAHLNSKLVKKGINCICLAVL